MSKKNMHTDEDTGIYPKVDNKKVWVAFHKGVAAGKPGHAFSSIIKGWTASKYSHVELIFPDKYASKDGPLGISFSSRGSDDPTGVQFKEIHYSHPDRWDFVELKCTAKEKNALLDYCMFRRGLKYGYGDLIAVFVLPFLKKLQNKKKFFCSEIIAHSIGAVVNRLSNLFDMQPSPGELSSILFKDAGYFFTFDKDGDAYRIEV